MRNGPSLERMCHALEVPELRQDPRFAGNRARVANNDALDSELSAAVAKFTLNELLARFVECEAAAVPVNSIEQVFADRHVAARENIVTVCDDELGNPVRFQNFVGKLSATPGRIRYAAAPVGSSNRALLIDELGFKESELALE